MFCKYAANLDVEVMSKCDYRIDKAIVFEFRLQY